MGFLVEWHIPKGKFDFGILDTLPSGLWVNVFEIDECKFSLIYADFRSSKIFPKSFGDKYDKLNMLYESLTNAGTYVPLIDAGLEIALNPQVVNLNLWLSNALQDEVISIQSDDDQLDLAVQSKSGSLSRLRFRAEDIEVLYENDEVHIFPLITEMNEPVVDLQKFDCGAFTIHPHEKEQSSELHEIASEEIESFLGIKPQAIGLATWDFDEERLRQVFTGKKKERAASKKSAERWTGRRAERVAPQKNKQLSLKARFTLMMLAVFAVSAFNGYREYEKSGHLDQLWYITVGATIVLVLIIFAVLAKRK